MARIVNGKYTASMEEPFVEFMIGMWHPRHKRQRLRAGTVPNCSLADDNASTV